MQEPKTFDLAGLTELQQELKGFPCRTCLNFKEPSEPHLMGFCAKYSAHQWPTLRLFDCWSHVASSSLSGKLKELEVALSRLLVQMEKRK